MLPVSQTCDKGAAICQRLCSLFSWTELSAVRDRKDSGWRTTRLCLCSLQMMWPTWLRGARTAKICKAGLQPSVKWRGCESHRQVQGHGSQPEKKFACPFHVGGKIYRPTNAPT